MIRSGSWDTGNKSLHHRVNHALNIFTAHVRTILLLISWKWISHTFSTTSSFSKVTKPKPGKEREKKTLKETLVTFEQHLKAC